MALAVFGAVALFVAVFAYVQSVSRQVGPLATAYRFSKPVARLQPITKDQMEAVQYPARWLPTTAIRSFDTTRGLVAMQDVAEGSLLQQGMAGPPPELKPGQREIAIMINAETGVAGRVQPGNLVDIYATFADSQTKSAQARVIVTNAQVLAIGSLQRVDGPADNGSGGTKYQASEVVPVTFALSVPDSLKVAFAESFAVKMRLALVAPGTRSGADPRMDVLTQQQVFNPPRAATPTPTGKPTPTPTKKKR
jgi:pilus assembly protein CpaB